MARADGIIHNVLGSSPSIPHPFINRIKLIMAPKKNKLTDKEIAIRELKTKARIVMLNAHIYHEKSHQKEFKTVLKWNKEQYTIFAKRIKELVGLVGLFEYMYFEEMDRLFANEQLPWMCRTIIAELEQALLMLKNCEELFQNSTIIQKCYKLLKVNHTIFTRLQPFI